MERTPVFLYLLLAVFSILLMIIVIKEFLMKPKSKDQPAGEKNVEPPIEQKVQSTNLNPDEGVPAAEAAPSPRSGQPPAYRRHWAKNCWYSQSGWHLYLFRPGKYQL